MKAPRIMARMNPFPGMSLRDTAHAIGAAKRIATKVTATP